MRGERVDYVFDALVGRQQPKRENELAPVESDVALAILRAGHLGDAMWDHVDLVSVDAVYGVQQLRAVTTHHDDAIGAREHFVHHGALRGARRAQHRVQRRHDRFSYCAHQAEHVRACLAAEDPVLVLERDRERTARVHDVRGGAIGFDVAVVDVERDALRIVVMTPRLVHREHRACRVTRLPLDRCGEIRRERRDAAVTRQVVADHRDRLRAVTHVSSVRARPGSIVESSRPTTAQRRSSWTALVEGARLRSSEWFT